MPRFKTWHFCAGLLALTVVAYAPVRHNGFVDFDDEIYLTRNPEALNGLSGSGFRWAWTTFHANYYQPLTWLSLQFDAHFFSTQPPEGPPVVSALAVHGQNLFWHAGSVLLLFALWRRLTGAPWCSFVVAALFAVHPMHVESVAWAAERKDVLSTFFGILALVAYAHYADRPSPGRYLGVAVAFLLSLLAKPMLMTLPFVLLLLDYWPLRRWRCGRQRFCEASLNLLEKLPLFALAAAIAVLTVVARRQNNAPLSLDVLPLSARLATAATGYGWYLLTSFWPLRLAAFYPHPEQDWSVAAALAGTAALLLLTGLALWQARRRPWLLVGWLWFASVLLPVIGLAQGGTQAWADRFSYFAHLGLFVAIVWTLAEAVERWRLPAPAVAAVTASLLACLGTLTWMQVATWRDTATLWRNVLAVTRNNHRAHVNLGKWCLENGRPDEAETHFAEAVRLKPQSPDYRHFHGIALLALGKLPEAAERFRQVLAESPRYADAWHNLGVVRLRQRQPARAAACFRKALALQPDSSDSLSGLGAALWRQGQQQKAVRAFRSALALNPADAEAWHGRGLARLVQGEPGKAVGAFANALRCNPGMVKAAGDLGLALGRLGYWDEAVAHFRNAVQLMEAGESFLARVHGRPCEPESVPQIVILRCRLAFALGQLGQHQAATNAYRQALQRDPHWPWKFLRKAWGLTVTVDSGARDAQLALELAFQAVAAAYFFSMSDCVLTTVYSPGKVWKVDRNRQPGRASTLTKPRGATLRRWWPGKWCSRPRLLPSLRISSWTCRNRSGGSTST